MNPELSRNAWLELTPTRRWGVPVTLALIVLTVVMIHPLALAAQLPHDLAATGLALFAIFSIWGATKAMGSITGEITANTWDLQRMAGHRPVDLLVGKILGSTIGEWYGAGMALALFTFARLIMVPPWIVGLEVVTLIAGALLMQTLAVFGSLATANTVRSTRRPGRGLGNQGAGLLVAVGLGSILMPIGAAFLDPNTTTPLVHWWVPLPLELFLPLSVLTFLGWAAAGALRLVRAELQEPVTPWPWLGFLAFLTVYLYPLTVGSWFDAANSSIVLFVTTATLVFGFFVPPLVLGERKDVVRLRQLAAAWVRGDRQAVLTQLPLWTFTLAGYTACVAALGVLAAIYPSPGRMTLFGVALGMLLMMLRDVGLVMAVHLSPRPARDPGMVTMFLFAMMYGLFPGVIAAAGESFHWALLLFFPFLCGLPESGLVAAPALLAAGLGVPGVAATWAMARPRLQRALHPADE